MPSILRPAAPMPRLERRNSSFGVERSQLLRRDSVTEKHGLLLAPANAVANHRLKARPSFRRNGRGAEQLAHQDLGRQGVVHGIPRGPGALESETRNPENLVLELQNMLLDTEVIPTAISMVTPYLLLGNLDNALDTKALRKLGVTHVLNMAGTEASSVAEYSKVITNFHYLSMNALDHFTYDMNVHIATAHSFIEQCRQTGGRVLVHCVAGVNRSVFVTCAHLLLRGKHLFPVVTRLKWQRGMLLTNASFLLQLVKLAQRLNLL